MPALLLVRTPAQASPVTASLLGWRAWQVLKGQLRVQRRPGRRRRVGPRTTNDPAAALKQSQVAPLNRNSSHSRSHTVDLGTSGGFQISMHFEFPWGHTPILTLAWEVGYGGAGCACSGSRSP